MKIVLLDGNKIKKIGDLHETFKTSLDFPPYYGNNLDALHDALTDITESVGIILVNVEELADNLGSRFGALMDLLSDFEGSNIEVCFDPFDELDYADGDEEG